MSAKPMEHLVFNKDRHIKYWLRCAKTFLPHQYTSNDSSRMTLAFFIVSALDLLDVLTTKITHEERTGWIQWIYSCQTADGGFRGFTGTNLGDLRNEDNRHWDPANLPATFFALLTLIVLRDKLENVDRARCRSFVSKLQRKNGSFGEILAENDLIEGGNDLRFCCCAAGIFHLLGDAVQPADTDHKQQFDKSTLISYIKACQTFEGAFSEGPLREAHSGLTYCAVTAVSFVGKLSQVDTTSSVLVGETFSQNALVEWLVQRQTTFIVDTDSDDEYMEREEDPDPVEDKDAANEPSFDESCLGTSSDVIGFNGRANKIADTCYCWWNMGTLSILGKQNLVNHDGVRKYLLGKVQHLIGGFGKGIDEPPDILHSYLGLAALGVLAEPGIKRVNAELCVSQEVALRAKELRLPRG